MSTTTESQIQYWRVPMSAYEQLRQLATVLAGTLGAVMVVLMAWLVLAVVR
jgi:hypothetical protein